ncbi:MAG: helix-turn-helix domain-containing protein [Actinomycetota bacterium]|nr:helix-turn-helix domain-containing protein [Actinomycetota bacterium]
MTSKTTATMTTAKGGPEIEGLLSLEEVAKILGVSHRTTKSLVYRGELTSVRLRRRRLVRQTDLRNFIAALDT